MTDAVGASPTDAPGLRWGVLGTGGIAQAFVTDLANLRTHSVVAVGSRTAAGAAAFGDRFAVPRRYDSVAGLVGDPDVEAVYVATPHPAHAQGALAAVAAGKHVLVEKAFTVDADQAHAIADAARAAGVVVLEAMWTRFLPHTVAIRELVAAGAIGEVRTVVADHGQWFAPDPAHRLFDPDLGGGALLDLGIYPLSWASMILGTPSRVTAVSDPAFTGVDAQTSVILQYPGGAHAVLTSTLEALTPRRAWIAGTEGTIEVDPTFYALTSFTLTRRDGRVERFETPAESVSAGGGKGLRFEAAELARCVAEGLSESPHLPVAESVSIMETMDEIRRQIGLVYPGEEALGALVCDAGDHLVRESSTDDTDEVDVHDVDPDEQPLGDLLLGMGLEHLGNAGCLTFVAGAEEADVLTAFGADLSGPMTVEEAGDAMVDAVCVLRTPGGVVVAEENGYQGSRAEVLRVISGSGTAASMFWNINMATRLSLARDGEITFAEELIGLDDPSVVEQLPGPLVAALADEEADVVAPGIEAAALFAGLALDDVRFPADVVVHPLVGPAEDFHPGSPEYTTLAWSMADLVARVVAAPAPTQRAIAEWAASDRLAAAGLDTDPAVVAVTSSFGAVDGGPAPSFEPAAALHELLRRESELLRRTDPSRHGGETGPELARADVRLAALETLRHACWPVPVEAAIGALEGVLGTGGPHEQRALREIRLLLDRAS